MPVSTSTERTYRYVRLGILGAVLALGVAVVVVLAGGTRLSSISALHYTAGAAVFTGSLFALSFALLVLAGHSPSRGLLDLAALLAPLIAILPTPIAGGEIPGVAAGCDRPCVPAAELPGIAAGLTTFFVVAAVAIIAALVLSRVQGELTGGVLATAAVAGALTLGVLAWWLAAPDGFVLAAHVVAATAFFALVAAVAGLAARQSERRYRALYLAVAVAIAADLVVLLTVVVLRLAGVDLVRASGVPLVFVGESIALALFTVLWTAQTVQHWTDIDPALRLIPPTPLEPSGDRP